MPQSVGLLYRVKAVVDGFAVCSQLNVEQLDARVVMAAVVERRQGPKLFAYTMGLLLGSS